jgi:hypothetical protein
MIIYNLFKIFKFKISLYDLNILGYTCIIILKTKKKKKKIFYNF